jgi:hypothetical protein
MNHHPDTPTGDIARLLAWARHLSAHRSSVTTDERAAFLTAKHTLLTRLTTTDPPTKDEQP